MGKFFSPSSKGFYVNAFRIQSLLFVLGWKMTMKESMYHVQLDFKKLYRNWFSWHVDGGNLRNPLFPQFVHSLQLQAVFHLPNECLARVALLVDLVYWVGSHLRTVRPPWILPRSVFPDKVLMDGARGAGCVKIFQMFWCKHNCFLREKLGTCFLRQLCLRKQPPATLWAVLVQPFVGLAVNHIGELPRVQKHLFLGYQLLLTLISWTVWLPCQTWEGSLGGRNMWQGVEGKALWLLEEITAYHIVVSRRWPVVMAVAWKM